jgi:hypothetical protein
MAGTPFRVSVRAATALHRHTPSQSALSCTVPCWRFFPRQCVTFSTGSKFVETLRARQDEGLKPSLKQPAPPVAAPAPAAAAAAPESSAPEKLLTAASITPSALPKNLLQRIKTLLSEYGLYALAPYSAMWVVPLGTLFSVFYAYDSFGHNPASILQFFGVKDSVFAYLGLSPDARPERYQIAGIYAFLITDLLEMPRIALSIYLAPHLRSAWLRWRGEGADGGKKGSSDATPSAVAAAGESTGTGSAVVQEVVRLSSPSPEVMRAVAAEAPPPPPPPSHPSAPAAPRPPPPAAAPAGLSAHKPRPAAGRKGR